MDKVFSIIEKEKQRQLDTLELIPSENYVSQAVLRALGSEMNNKYSECYPGKRYYGGNIFVDEIENIAIERAKKLFGTNHANVQPYSGSPANMATCFALLEPGEKLMGMSLSYGGHLTHGHAVNFSARYYGSAQYPTGKDGWLDYDLIEEIARRERPKLIFCGATAYSRVFDFRRLGEIATSVDAFLVADVAHIAGLIIGGVHPTPVGIADVITTTTHKTLRGPRGAMILCNGNSSDPLKVPEKTRNNLPSLIDRAVFPGLQGGPHNHTTAGIAVALGEALEPSFAEYAKQIVKNAKVLGATLIENGLDVVTGGTDNHLLLLDLTKIGITGKEAETLLDIAGITVNKNTVPFDKRKPFDPSGIRLGTPVVTTRGMKESHMGLIGDMIVDVLIRKKKPEYVRESVFDLCKDFPAFAW